MSARDENPEEWRETARPGDTPQPSDAAPQTVLEHNLRRLFAVSYMPVTYTPEFRARLSRALAGERRSRSGARDGAASHALPRQRSRFAWVAAAIVLIAIGAWIATFFHSRVGSRMLTDIMARGAVAMRDDLESEWRALDPIEARRGLDLEARALSVATPDGSALELRFGSRGHTGLEPRTRATVDARGEELEVRLDEGGLRLERYASGSAWTVAACGAEVELERGVLGARIADAEPHGATGRCLVVALLHGEAHARIDGARSDLRIGVELVLQDGRTLAANVGIDDPRTGGAATIRTAVGATTASGTTPSGTTPTTGDAAPKTSGQARLLGTVSRADGSGRPRQYTVTLLRRERLPAVSTPQSSVFEGAERFVYERLTPGTYDVFVEAAGVAVWHRDGVVLAADLSHTLDVVLAPGLSLRGRVVSAATGAPLEGATVLVEDEVPAQVIPFATGETAYRASSTTSSDGTFRLDALGPGAHVLRATKSGFGAAWSAPVDASQSDTVELRLSAAGSLKGRVAHEDGTPFASAVVIASFLGRGRAAPRFGYGLAIADSLGQYAITDLPAGDYVLLNVFDARAAHAALAAKQIRVEAGETTIANLPETPDGSRVHGRVLDASGSPLAALDVTLQPRGVHDASGWRSERTDESGYFVFAGLPAGAYDVFVGEGLGERFVLQGTLEVPRAGAVEHDIRLDRGAIRGRALRADPTEPHATPGGPLAGALLLLEVLERGAFTFAGRGLSNEDGTFAFEHLRPDTYRVTVYPLVHGLAPAASGELWVARDKLEVSCELRVERGASLRVLVRDAQHAPVPGAAVHFLDGQGRARQYTASDVTGSDGSLVVPGIERGRFRVSASRGDTHTNVLDIELEPGDERELALEFENR